MKTIRIAISLCLLSVALYAADEDNFIPGQVLRVDGSRLSTLVKVPETATAKAVIFKDSETGQNTEVESSEIRSITVVLNGETVEYINTLYIDQSSNRSGQSVWIRTLSWGEIVLYASELSDGRSIYLLKRSDELLPREISSNSFKTTIVSYIADHSYLTKDVESNKYSFKDLKVLMDEYNSWKSFE
ncbi:hypothetical protein [Fulvivirga sedimenti]|uniref:Uncharacterized protein n=1 Tax=Fulvivirga sedimenti TaxID=2879465 RepID=A0A9X1HRA0_9BACT|nr:hypothetical protein [Fulvivirga sedimenti]MCA6074549.1 hypothetical protein [Fulvivirga sedimenti]MCA6075726.1 hypothetical protein [Fulvivirga sedimenti]MCA6076854.1 hypothetical protein [Fulvivirga sedimenti]